MDTGTLTGGSAPQGGSVLVEMQRLHSMSEKLAAARDELAQLEVKLKGMTAAEQQVGSLTETRELCHHQVCGLVWWLPVV